jgi:hypothetical protein
VQRRIFIGDEIMVMYFEGHNQAQKALQEMDEQSLLEVLDGLYGRDNLSEEYDLDELRQEASRQVRRDFTNPDCSTDENIEFWTKVMEATRNSGC